MFFLKTNTCFTSKLLRHNFYKWILQYAMSFWDYKTHKIFCRRRGCICVSIFDVFFAFLSCVFFFCCFWGNFWGQWLLGSSFCFRWAEAEKKLSQGLSRKQASVSIRHTVFIKHTFVLWNTRLFRKSTHKAKLHSENGCFFTSTYRVCCRTTKDFIKFILRNDYCKKTFFTLNFCFTHLLVI